MSRIRFEIIPPIEGPHEPVFITGSIPELGDWHAGSAFALRWEPPFHVGSIDIAAGTRFEYKITRGSWPREAVDAWGHVPENSNFTAFPDTTVRVTVADWKDRYAGRLTTDRVVSDGLAGVRDLLVWLPPEYSSDLTRRFPVVYFFDGNNIFDPKTSPLTGVDWAADEWCRMLASAGEMPPAILVAVRHPGGHGEDGRSLRDIDLSMDYAGSAFSNFVASELVGYIDSRYRTLAHAGARVLVGASYGGLNACLTAFGNPGVFQKAICFSTSFEDTAEHLPGQCPSLQSIEDRGTLPSTMRMVFAFGDEGLDECYEPYHRELAGILRAGGWKDGREFQLVQIKGGSHGEGSWRLWLGDAFRFVCGQTTK